MDNIKITLESLYDILRNEKKKEDLQKLDRTFFLDVINYLKEKKALLEQNSEGDELFAVGEKEKVGYELRSIKRIQKELYEKREKKIIDIALNRSRTGSDIIDTEAMLKEEKEFYQQLLKTLDLYRRGILLNLFQGKLPLIISKEERKEKIRKEIEQNSLLKIENPVEESNEETPNEEVSDEEPAPEEESSETDSVPVESAESKEEVKSEEKKVKTKIKFIHPTPSFVWKDMKVYGPFDQGEETEIFPEVADLLVRKGRAEKI